MLNSRFCRFLCFQLLKNLPILGFISKDSDCTLYFAHKYCGEHEMSISSKLEKLCVTITYVHLDFRF